MRDAAVKIQTWAGATIVGLATLGGAAPSAHAHPELVANQINRYLTVAVMERRFELSVALLFGELPAVVERKRIDTNQDASISEEELREAEAYWARRAEALASFTGQTNGAGPWQAVLDLGDDRTTGTVPLVVDLRREGTLPDAPTLLGFGPKDDLPALGETEIGIVLGPGWKLRKSSSPDGKSGLDRVFKLPVDSQRSKPALAHFDLEPEKHQTAATQMKTSHPSQRRLWLVGGAIALAGFVLAALGWRRKKTHN